MVRRPASVRRRGARLSARARFRTARFGTTRAGPPLSPGRRIRRPRGSPRGQFRPPPLVRLRVRSRSLQRSPAAPYRPQATDLRAIPLRRWPRASSAGHPSPTSIHATSPLRILAPRVSTRGIRQQLGDAARAGHSRPPFLFGTRTGLAVGLFSRPGRVAFAPRRRSWGSPVALRSVAPRPRVTAPCWSAPRSHLPFRHRDRRDGLIVPESARVGAGRGSRVAAAPGVWPRGRSRAVDVVGPARAFVHRAGRSVRPGLPWAFAPLSGVRRRPLGPASRAVDARGLLGGCVVPSAGWDGATARALRRMTPGRRLFAPAVFPPGRSPRMRFSRRPPDVRPTVVGRVPCRVFFKDARGVAGG